MSDGLSKHIGALTLGSDAGEEKPGDGTMDGGDVTVDEIVPLEQRAVPDSVIDEQAEVFEKTGKPTEDKDDGKPLDYKALYEAEQKASGGRLGELRTVRTELTQTKDGIESLRKVFLEREQKEAARLADEQKAFELEEERRLYGDEVIDDPAVAYMRDKMVQTQDMLAQQQAQQEEYRQRVTEEASQLRSQQERWLQTQNAVRAQEEQFASEVPDYNDAYQYARDKRMEMYQSRGYTAQQAEVYVDQEEEGIRQEQLSRPGGSVPKAVYEVAKLFGWDSSMAVGNDDGSDPGPKIKTEGVSAPNFEKMRRGVTSQGAGGMHGSTGSHDGSRALSAEEFFNTVSVADRLEILSDPEKFEELGRTGQIVLD